MRQVCAVLALFLSFAASLLQGQELCYETALKLFSANSPHLKSARMLLEKRISESNDFATIANPEIAYERENMNSGADIEEVIKVEQSLQIMGQPFIKNSIHSYEVDAFTLLYDYDVTKILTDFRNHFDRVLLEKEKTKIINETYGIVQKAYNAAHERYKEGNVSGFELNRFRVALNGYRKNNDNGLLTYYESLGKFLTTIYDAEKMESLYEVGIQHFDLVGELMYSNSNYDLKSIQDTALANRKDLKAIEILSGCKEDLLLLEKLNRFPDLKIGGGYKKVKEMGDGYIIGLSMELPLFNFNGNKIQQAEIEHDLSKVEYDNKRKEILLECHNVFNTLESLGSQLKILQGEQNRSDILETAVLLYTEGQISLVELIDAAEAHSESKTLFYETLYDYNAALNELDKVLGKCEAGEL